MTVPAPGLKTDDQLVINSKADLLITFTSPLYLDPYRARLLQYLQMCRDRGLRKTGSLRQIVYVDTRMPGQNV